MEPSKSIHRGRRVFLFPLPFQGHINPMFQIAALLHRRGFSITIFHTQLNYPDITRHTDFNFIPIPDGFAENPPPSDNLLGRVMALNTNCVGPFREQAARLVSEGTGEPVVAVIVDVMMFAVRAAAEEMGLRTMVLRTGSAASCNLFFAFPLLWEKGYLPIRDCGADPIQCLLSHIELRWLDPDGEYICSFLVSQRVQPSPSPHYSGITLISGCGGRSKRESCCQAWRCRH